MSIEEKEWHPRFNKYMEEIVSHPNYKGLPITRKSDGSLKWIAPAKSDIGIERIEWCNNKAVELGLNNTLEPYPGMYADVMREIHPTKWKVCQICGREMSIYYHYPNANFLKSLNNKFNTNFSDCDHISDIWDELIYSGFEKEVISEFFIEKGSLDTSLMKSSKEEIINELELSCRKGNKKCLGPGAMSDFPDRFDGFHTYNRCCRATEDKGRSASNLKTYTKDRRAYEYWSDGNIHAANLFMGSDFFDGISADHVGPISLGFIHDPRYLQPMSTSDNSAKRDRLQLSDVKSIIETEKRTKIYPMTWYSSLLWEYIRNNYEANNDKIPTTYRDLLKENMSNYMYILYNILTKCPNHGEEFLVDAFLKDNYEYFKYSYKFNELGDIISKEERHFTERNINEFQRYKRIAIESVYDYQEKKNRNVKAKLTSYELETLSNICKQIESNNSNPSIKEDIVELVEEIQRRLLATM